MSEKSNCTKFERGVYSKLGENKIREYAIDITPSRLDELDADRGELDKFTKDKFSKLRNSNEMNMMVFRVDVSKEKLEERHISMLSNLLQLSGNDIIVPPFVKISKESKFDVDQYLSYYRTFEDYLGSTISSIACPIPGQSSTKDIRQIMNELGGKHCQIFVVDFDGQKVISPSNEISLRTVMGGIRNLEKEYGEGSFFYGFDARPNPKNGTDKDFIESQILASVGLNAVGPKRKRTVLPPNIAKLLGESDPLDVCKLFCEDDYRQYSIRSGRVTEDFSTFVDDMWGIDYSTLKYDKMRELTAAFNHNARSENIPNINQSISENTLVDLIQSKNTPEYVMKVAKKVAKKVTGV